MRATRPPFDPGSASLGARARVVGVVVEGVGAGCPAGIAGGLSHSGGASIVFVVSFKLGITYQDRFRHEKKATNWSPSHRFGRASPSCRASLPARVEPGVHPHVRSHCSWRVPIDAWMSAEFFINVRREV